jgi:hypothetical protein
MSDLDFPSWQAREFTDNHEKMNSEKWYDEFKFKLFDDIKKEALNGINSLVVTYDFWGKNEARKKHLISNLESLGYKVKFEKDNFGECIIISW